VGEQVRPAAATLRRASDAWAAAHPDPGRVPAV